VLRKANGVLRRAKHSEIEIVTPEEGEEEGGGGEEEGAGGEGEEGGGGEEEG